MCQCYFFPFCERNIWARMHGVCVFKSNQVSKVAVHVITHKFYLYTWCVHITHIPQTIYIKHMSKWRQLPYMNACTGVVLCMSRTRSIRHLHFCMGQSFPLCSLPGTLLGFLAFYVASTLCMYTPRKEDRNRMPLLFCLANIYLSTNLPIGLALCCGLVLWITP